MLRKPSNFLYEKTFDLDDLVTSFISSDSRFSFLPRKEKISDAENVSSESNLNYDVEDSKNESKCDTFFGTIESSGVSSPCSERLNPNPKEISGGTVLDPCPCPQGTIKSLDKKCLPEDQFENLVGFLSRVFNSLPAETELAGLERGEAEVAFAVLNRKLFKNAFETVTIDPFQSLARMLEQNPRTRKRNEEKIRFVLKHFFSLLKKRFSRATPNPPSNAQIDQEFFETYFAPFATPEESFEVFRDRTGMQGSVSFSKLMTAFKSPLIFKEFELATMPSPSNSCLLQEFYVQKISKKLKKLFSRWKAPHKSTPGLPSPDSDIVNYFKNNRQCKLPWMPNEIIEAIREIKKSIKF